MGSIVALTATTDLGLQIMARAAERSGGIKTLAEGRSDEFRVNPFLIKVQDGFNVRDFETQDVADHVDALAISIASVGVKRALKVRNKGGDLVLVDGECRLRATVRAIEVYGADIRTIPVKLADRSESDADATLGILVENSGLEVTPLGKAEVVKRLMNYGWSKSDIAEKSGMSKTRLGQLLDIAGLSPDMKRLISADVISATTAVQTVKANGGDTEKAVDQIKAASGMKMAASGKARVTAKGLSSGPSIKDTMAAIIGAAAVETFSDNGEDSVMLTISAADYEVVRNVLKLS
jgi:ParB-like chromosome segregation protein Spo0J